jgi:uncharacterized protein (DUF362 family)/Ni,Fe-hydrogenase III small subunit
LKRSIELCDGFKNLCPSDRVIIKPNLVAWDDQFPIAPFGVYTTTRLVEDLIICLKNFGCSNITIGEGSVLLKKDMGTLAAFEGLGYKTLEKKYGVSLVDFNESKAEEFTYHNGNKLFIAKEAVESDFFINFPVLKTHSQTKISLGLKNLKGCLKLKSKRHCHNPESGLEFSFSHIADFVKPALTIIDGIYALEKGALHFGKAYRKDIIIASRDILGAELAGAQLIGYAAKDIEHFKHYSKRSGKSLAITDYEIKGEKIDDHIQPLKWDWTWTKDNTGPGIFEKLGVTGVSLPKYDDTLCSGCSPIANMSNILALSAFKGQPLPNVEILNGKKMQARPGYEKTVLLGNCIIKANKENENINDAVKVKGCPPSENDVVAAMKSVGLDVNILAYYGYMKQQSEKYNGKEGYEKALFGA